MPPQRLTALAFKRRQAAYKGQIFLVNLALGKSCSQSQAVGFCKGDYKKAAGILVQAVHNAGSLPFKSGQLRKAPQKALHQRLFRAGRARMNRKPRGFVADHKVIILPEQFQMPFFGLKAVRMFRQVQSHGLPHAHFGCGAFFRQSVHGTATGLHDLLQGCP